MDNAHCFPSTLGVPEEVLGDQPLAEAGVLSSEKHFHGCGMETVWSLFTMAWYPADFTGMNH